MLLGLLQFTAAPFEKGIVVQQGDSLLKSHLHSVFIGLECLKEVVIGLTLVILRNSCICQGRVNVSFKFGK